MNCKPGDLAALVGGGPADRHLIGRIVRVTCLSGRGAPCWEYEGKRLTTKYGVVTALADAALRPIRDPGEDARDETLSWKTVPLPVLDPSLLEVGK